MSVNTYSYKIYLLNCNSLINFTLMKKYEQLRLLTENKMVKQLIDYDQIYINVHSSDCDGGHSNYGLTFSTIPEVYKWEGRQAEYADGPFGWDVVEPSELIKEPVTWFTR